MNKLRTIIINFLLYSFIIANVSTIDSLDSLREQADILAKNGDINIALTVYLNILEQEQSVYSENDSNLARTLNRIGELYFSIGENDLAQIYIQRAINIYEYEIIETQKEVRLSLTNLLKSQIALGDSQKIDLTKSRLIEFEELDNPYLVKGISFNQEQEDFSEEDSAIELLDLAFTFLDRGMYSQAAENFSSALLLQTSNLDLDYFQDFIISDSLQQKQLISAFKEIQSEDSLITG